MPITFDGDDCGEFQCQVDGSGYLLVDPHTGEVRHRLPGWVAIVRTEQGFIGSTGVAGTKQVQLYDLAADRLIDLPAGWVMFSERSLAGSRRPLRELFTDTLAVQDHHNGLYLAEFRTDGLHFLGSMPHPLVNEYVLDGRVLAYRFSEQIWWWRLG
jgi:hypothetical protein